MIASLQSAGILCKQEKPSGEVGFLCGLNIGGRNVYLKF